MLFPKSSFSKQKQIWGLIAWLVVCFSVSAMGAFASLQPKSFYAQLTQPSWAPPGWLFGPVWSTLFTMMAISAWLVWRSGGFNSNQKALSIFLIHLIFNGLWSWLFFAWNLGGLAFADIIVLWSLILTTIVLFWRTSSASGMLLIPYLMWVSFASVLSFTMWQLNPQLLG